MLWSIPVPMTWPPLRSGSISQTGSVAHFRVFFGLFFAFLGWQIIANKFAKVSFQAYTLWEYPRRRFNFARFFLCFARCLPCFSADPEAPNKECPTNCRDFCK